MRVTGSIVKHLSFCLITVDSFRGTVYGGPLKIWTNRELARYIKKGSGVYAFINQPQAHLIIEAWGFKKFETYVDSSSLNTRNPIVTARLIPDRHYVYPSFASAASLRFIDSKGNPVGSASINCYIDCLSGFEAVLTEDSHAGADLLKVLDIYGNSGELSCFHIMSARDSDDGEYMESGGITSDGFLSLTGRLKYSHSTNDKITAACMTETDASGRAFIAFNRVRKPKVQVVAEVAGKGTFKEVRLELAEGKILDLGNVVV